MKTNLTLWFYTLIATMLLSLHLPAFAQNDIETKSKAAEKAYNKATTYLNNKNYEEAAAELQKAVRADPNFTQAWLLLGDVYLDLKNSDDAIDSYNEAIKSGGDTHSIAYYLAASAEYNAGKYKEAKEHFEAYLNHPKVSRAKTEPIAKKIKNCEFAIEAMKHPVPFNPINMGDSVNSPNDEYLPALTADENTLIITVRRPRDRMTLGAGTEEEDFYISQRINGVWSKAKVLPPPLNSHGNEGAQCISSDGKYIYFTACNREDGFGSCDIYYSKRVGNIWSTPVNLGPIVNSTKWDSQPSLTSDGKTLYFASARAGGKGGMDIWQTTLGPNGFSPPENLGDSINTEGNEMSPFIHSDNKTLYFASDGHPGFGKYDIFVSRKDTNGVWGKPKNLGYPINSSADEINMMVNNTGNYAYFSSNKLGGVGKYDLYYFELYDEARPQTATYLKGIVYDEITKKPLAAKFELIDLSKKETTIESTSDAENGSFLVSLPSDRNYALNVSLDGYLFYSENFMLSGVHSNLKPYLKDIPLKPIQTGETVVLKNIFFDTDKFDLKSESKVEMDKLLQLLQKNSKIKIEISGHTDNIGNEQHNVALSKSRAKSVYDYLVNAGIKADRLTYTGYGFSKPIDTNDTEAGRANNRRTEFKITQN
ncbi:MAG: OmpA family protein [Bacteroidota bacterium]